MKTQYTENSWIKMGRLNRSIPMLKHIHPLFIPLVIFAGFSIYFIVVAESGPPSCTCDQLIKDDELKALGLAGNKEVQSYLNHVDDYLNCEARRADLLRELEHKRR